MNTANSKSYVEQRATVGLITAEHGALLHDLQMSAHLSVIGCPEDSTGVTAFITTQQPDWLVIHLDIGEKRAEKVLAAACKLAPSLRAVIILPDCETKALPVLCFGQGVRVVAGHTTPPVKLSELMSVSERLDVIVVERQSHTTVSPQHFLTGREKEVLALLQLGLSNSRIAKDLHISMSTVQFHVGNIMRKVGASNRVEATVKGRTLLAS